MSGEPTPPRASLVARSKADAPVVAWPRFAHAGAQLLRATGCPFWRLMSLPSAWHERAEIVLGRALRSGRGLGYGFLGRPASGRLCLSRRLTPESTKLESPPAQPV